MRINFIFAAIAAVILCAGQPLAASDPQGFLIYTDQPSTYIESCEFNSLDASKPAYYTIVRADGQHLQINPGGLWVVVDYPPPIPPVDLEETANLNIKKIQELLSKYPQFKARLLAAQAKWQNALAFSKQQEKQRVATEPVAGTPSTITLEVDGTKYEEVSLSSVEGENVGITHSAGVTKLELEKLTKEQIMALNTTSTSLQIDPGWQAKKKQTKPGLAQPPPQNESGSQQGAQNSNQTLPAEMKAMVDTYSKEKLVEPDLGGRLFSPTYGETIEFINGKIGLPTSIGFGEKTQKMILKMYDNVYIFDPKDMNAEVRYGQGDPFYHVTLQCKNNAPKIICSNPYFPNSEVTINCRDNLDAEKLANAFAHLILMFGGTKEAF